MPDDKGHMCLCQKHNVTFSELCVLLLAKLYLLEVLEEDLGTMMHIMTDLYATAAPGLQPLLGKYTIPFLPPKPAVSLKPQPSKKQMIMWIHHLDLVGEAMSDELDRAESRVRTIQRVIRGGAKEGKEEEEGKHGGQKWKGKKKRCPNAIPPDLYDIHTLLHEAHDRFQSMCLTNNGMSTFPSIPPSRPIGKGASHPPTRSVPVPSRSRLPRKSRPSEGKKIMRVGSSGLIDEDKGKLPRGDWRLVKCTELDELD